MKIKTISDLQESLNKSEQLRNQLEADPLGFVSKLEDKHPIEDKKVFLAVVGIIGLVLIASIILGGIIIFKSTDTNNANVPEFIVAIGSTSLGALVGLLAPNPRD